MSDEYYSIGDDMWCNKEEHDKLIIEESTRKALKSCEDALKSLIAYFEKQPQTKDNKIRLILMSKPYVEMIDKLKGELK